VAKILDIFHEIAYGYDSSSTQGAALRIAISAEGPDLEAKVGDRFGLSQYLVIVDSETMAFEAVPNPGASGQRGTGIQAVVLAISKKVNTVLTGSMSPTVKRHLSANGIDVLTGLCGTVAEVIEKYKKGDLQKHRGAGREPEASGAEIDKVALVHALRSSANQFANLLPILVGVVLLIGIFKAIVSKELISSIFSGNTALDTLWGACFGSILAGNPINSYVIGGELLEYGVSLFAVTALIIAWVTVGVVQLPAEIAALGRRFALVRNTVSFALAIAIAIFTVVVLNFVTR
jgi:predicted Fe-Mo cluster-binding NifX family protein